MAEALQIAVVGHTNAGKTSLLRTLTRQVAFGEVSERPGTTRHVESIELRVDGRAAVRFFDTPGLEDAVTLLQHLQSLEGSTRPERVRRFLAGPEANGSFEQEAKVLRKMLEADAAFLVIDTREAVLPKFRDEVELLNSCATPVLPVLNFVRSDASREAQWREMLSAGGLHAVVRFDAAAPFTGAEQDLYHDLGALLPAQRQALRAVVAHLQREAQARRHAGCEVVAELLVDLAALRHTADTAQFDDTVQRDKLVQAMHREVNQRAQRAMDDLLSLYGFREGDAAEAPLPQVAGRWALDLFNPETLRDAGVRLGTGAAVGAAVGVVADLALAGLSLGAGAALGATIGGALAQGWGPFGRKLANVVRGVHELSVEDGVLALSAAWQLDTLLALERRGHAAVQPLAAGAAPDSPDAREGMAALAPIVAACAPARSHPAWARLRHAGDSGRQQLVHDIAAQLEALAQTRAPLQGGPRD